MSQFAMLYLFYFTKLHSFLSESSLQITTQVVSLHIRFNKLVGSHNNIFTVNYHINGS